MLSSSLYRDYDALAYNPKSVGEARGAVNHIKKAKQRKKGVEVVFDPKAHRYMPCTSAGCAPAPLLSHLVSSWQRRKEMKQQLGLPEDYGLVDSDDEPGGRQGRGHSTALVLLLQSV
eukprot:gene6032-6270_t